MVKILKKKLIEEIEKLPEDRIQEVLDFVGYLRTKEAKEVFNAGRELWKYYNSFNEINTNASLYDIREFFQGRNDKGRMNARSNDEKYTELLGELRNNLNILASKIKPKIYEYEFLKE